MIRKEIIDDYINYELRKSYDKEYKLDFLYDISIKDNIPIIKPEMEGFLRTILSILQPKRILELGSAIGYSGAVFLSYSNAHLYTVEKNTVLANRARQNFDGLGFFGRYNIYNSDILKCEEIKKNTYDFIFVDAAKSYYNEYFDLVKPLLNCNGIIVFDNVLHGGDIAMSKYTINRRQRTIHSKMKTFVSKVLVDKDFESTLLSISDGVILCKNNLKKS